MEAKLSLKNLPIRLFPAPANLLPWVLALAFFWILQLSPFFSYFPYFYEVFVYAGISVILSVSLNLVNGCTGQFSMGHAGFMSVGGYTAALVSVYLQTNHPAVFQEPFTAGILFFGILILSGLVASLAGYLVGIPSLRLRGDYLAIVTLGFGEIIRVIALNTKVLGEARGLSGIPPITNAGWVMTFVVITLFVVWRVLHAPQGRGFLAVREDEIAAEAMGVPSTKAKVSAFMIGSFFAGVAGGLFAHQILAIEPKTFDFNKSFEIITMVVLGGSGSVTGSVVAAILLTFLREALRSVHLSPEIASAIGIQSSSLDLRMIVYSLFLIILMLTRPNGLFGKKELTDFFPKKLKARWLGTEEART